MDESLDDGKQHAEEDEGSSRWAKLWGFVGGLLLLGLVGGVVLGFVLVGQALLPSRAPTEANPHWLDSIFDSRWVIWIARLTGLVVLIMFLVFAVYFVSAIVVRMRRGHWLRSGGPFEAEIIDKAEGAMDEAVDQWAQSLQDAEARAADLELQLSETNQQLESVYAMATGLIEDNAGLQQALAEQDPPTGA
jgi:hypothetical protein